MPYSWFKKLILFKALMENVVEMFTGFKLKRFTHPKGHHVQSVANLLGTMQALAP